MENDEKSFGQHLKDGYDRSAKLMGAKEDVSNARTILFVYGGDYL